MAQNDQPITERDENCKGEEYCGGAPVSPPEEQQDYETRKYVADSLDPHIGKAVEAPTGLSMKLMPIPMIATGITRVHQKSSEFLLKVELSKLVVAFICFLSPVT